MAAVVRRAVLFAVLGLSVTSCIARAGFPDPCANCTIPTYVDLGGCDASGQPDPAVSFSVRLRDIGNYPIVNCLVACSFSTDVRIYDSSPGFDVCQCVEATTGQDGVATFHVQGAGRNPGGLAGFTGASAATFHLWNSGNYYVLGTAHVATFDENGGVTTKGVDITDLSAWASDYNARLVPPVNRRSDFNHNGAVDIGDLALWIRVFLSQQSKYTCGAFCP